MTGLVVLCVALAHVECRRESSLRVLKFVSPRYPFVARVYHLAGSVNVEVEFAPDGKVLSAKGSGPVPVLNEAAERNVKQWQFDVPKKGPYPVVCTIVYDFKLAGKPSGTVGLTTVEFVAPDRVNIVDQPAFEKVPEPIPAEGISEPNDGPRLLQRFRDCYSKHCANQATGPIDHVPLGELIDCYSKHCEQELKDGH